MIRRIPALAAIAAATLGLAACERRVEPPPAAGPQTSGPIVAAPAGGAPASFAPIVKRVSPAVVSIDTLAVGGQELFGQLPPGLAPVRRGAGSGFIISGDGLIVTNNHVVEGAQQIVVALADGRQFPAKLVGRDPPTDLAVLKIDGRDLPYVSFAGDALPEVGDWVVAVGNPFGLGGTATAGIVSAHGREIGEAYVSYLQIDAPINSGNSGGPSFDMQGRVVGVNSAIFSPNGGSIGIGFAIPSDLAQSVTQQLIKSGRVTRGYLGVGVVDLTPALAYRLNVPGQRGAVIADLSGGGPAASVLRTGDVVTAVAGDAITGAGGLTRAIAGAAPGSDLSLTVIRSGQKREVTVKVARRPDDLG
jgi:serine protease Do